MFYEITFPSLPHPLRNSHDHADAFACNGCAGEAEGRVSPFRVSKKSRQVVGSNQQSEPTRRQGEQGLGQRRSRAARSRHGRAGTWPLSRLALDATQCQRHRWGRAQRRRPQLPDTGMVERTVCALDAAANVVGNPFDVCHRPRSQPAIGDGQRRAYPDS